MNAPPILSMLAEAPEICIPAEPEVVPVTCWAPPSSWATNSRYVVAARREQVRNLSRFALAADLPGSLFITDAAALPAVLR